MKRAPITALIAGTVTLLATGGLAADPVRDGAILSIEDGFPWKTYDEWLDSARRRMTFDEPSFRAQYPADDFARHKKELRLPFATYDEWLATIKRRSETVLSHWPEMEAETRRRYPPRMYEEFVATVDCSRILYGSDGLKIEGFVLRPRDASSARHPAVIYNHGGNSGIGGIDDGTLLGLTWLVRAGYVVVASQYRGCGTSEGSDEVGGADVRDVLNAILVTESLSFVDAERIGMWGWSRGGMMTYLVLARTTRIAAAVVGGAPTDIAAEIARRPAMGALLQKNVPEYSGHETEALRARSALCWPELMCRDTPILILQGSEDDRTVPESALEMALELKRVSHPFRLVFFEGGSHGLTEHAEEVKQQTLFWLGRYLAE